jgi:Ca2+-binding RTX toxin-like protein
MPRLSLLAVSLALPAALLLVPSSLGASRFGTDGTETLIGTNKADRITGAGGDDTLKGLAGNDTYYFADTWGSDTLEDLATYKVGGKTRPGGIDTLSFRG